MVSTFLHDRALSNRHTEYQDQTCILQDSRGKLTFGPVNRLVLTLPSEIISEIFLHCLPPAEFIDVDMSTAPLLLCRICRQWKQIALATPGLWSSLRLDVNDFRDERSYTDLDSVEFYSSWLKNAKHTPLNLQIFDCIYLYTDPRVMPPPPWFSAPGFRLSVWLRELDKPNAMRLLEVLKLIQQRATQWRSLDINLHSTYLDALFPSTRNFPFLESLVIESPTVPFAKLDGPFRSGDMPLLRELRLYENTASALVAFPWAQLTLFVTHKISVSDCVDVFRHASNLELCEVHVARSLTPVPIPPLRPITNIYDLSICDTWDAAEDFPLMQLLRHLTLPGLERLSLRFDIGCPADLSEFLSFASRFSYELLKSMSSLQRLDLGVRDADKICHWLTSRPNFLPKLRFLRLIYPEAELLPSALAHDFRSKWKGESDWDLDDVGMRSFVFRYRTEDAELLESA
ncbi:hypothetical protein C8J57DRAFT_1287762 [Mycena rebaudengoi]|nr:hypothetical protein C8J57DRAFT_1287762 [Mycena rebaudengoi]